MPQPLTMTLSPGSQSADRDSTTVPARSMPATMGSLRATLFLLPDSESVLVIQAGEGDLDQDVAVREVVEADVLDGRRHTSIKFFDDDCRKALTHDVPW